LVLVALALAFVLFLSLTHEEGLSTNQPTPAAEKTASLPALGELDADLTISYSIGGSAELVCNSAQALPSPSACLGLQLGLAGYAKIFVCRDQLEQAAPSGSANIDDPDSPVSGPVLPTLPPSRPCSSSEQIISIERPRLTNRPDPTQACTEIYGGPETLLVRGSLNGERINLRWGRSDGCQISEYSFWEGLAPGLNSPPPSRPW